jgi:hypothetical protein
MIGNVKNNETQRTIVCLLMTSFVRARNRSIKKGGIETSLFHGVLYRQCCGEDGIN